MRTFFTAACLLAAHVEAADFTFSVVGSSEALTTSAIKSAGAVEACVAKQAGPVVVLLFVGHEGLVVDVRSAPKGTEECVAKLFRALDLSDAQPHETITVIAGIGTPKNFAVTWPSSGLQVIDQDEQVAMATAFDRRPRNPKVSEGFAHAPLFLRCKKGEYVVMLSVSQGGRVTRVTGTRDACVTSVLEGMRFGEKGSVRLKVRLD